MDKVVVGMSGGVDSAVAAYLLKKGGYDVVGVTLRVWQSDDGEEGRCCDIDDARKVAYKLGIPYYPINCTSDFNKFVISPFIKDYTCGFTPNPCIECNRYVKWEKLIYYAKVIGAKYVATGHYASVIKSDNGRYTIKKALHTEKDQTYMLYKLTQEQLSATLMPLGNLSKDEVRKIAIDTDLPVALKKDSQEVCFVTDGSYADYIAKNADGYIGGEGDFVDVYGNVIGRHKGIINYTVGQRRGIGIALGYPAYVKEIIPKNNRVVIGDERSLYSSGILCTNVNYMGIPSLDKNDKLLCTVKVRYRHKGQKAQIEFADNDMIKVTFKEPVKAVTPGQSAVFYSDDGCIIGGAVIRKVLRDN